MLEMALEGREWENWWKDHSGKFFDGEDGVVRNDRWAWKLVRCVGILPGLHGIELCEVEDGLKGCLWEVKGHAKTLRDLLAPQARVVEVIDPKS